MPSRAASFLARGESLNRLARTLSDTVRQVPNAAGAMVFVSGPLANDLARLAEPLQTALGNVPALVVSGHGVLSDRGEVEGEAAMSGVVWSGGSAKAVAVSQGHGADLGVALARVLEPEASASSAAFVFVSPRGMAPHTLEPLRELAFSSITGGGTTPEGQVLALSPGSPAQVANAAALVVRGRTVPSVCASPACRLLTPLARISATRGPMVLEIEGERALEVLSASAAHLSSQPLILVALAPEAREGEETPLLLRGLQGVDPSRHGIVVSEEVHPGLRLAFATRDAGAGRAGLDTAVGRLLRETAGAAPHFGVYLSCAGRGASLYEAADVDTRIIRARIPDLPFAGMHSSFEIAPYRGHPTLQLYTGVLALFTSPS